MFGARAEIFVILGHIWYVCFMWEIRIDMLMTGPNTRVLTGKIFLLEAHFYTYLGISAVNDPTIIIKCI